MTMDCKLPDLSILRSSWAQYSDPGSTRVVDAGGVRIGEAHPVVIAGPCAVESFEQTLRIASAVRDAGAELLRGGCYKPRTNPHSFRGLGPEGLDILAAARLETGLGIVTEVMDPRLVGHVAQVADMIQIGSRSMQNFPLLTEVGRAGKPVLLKRAWSSTLEEWLCAAEYIAAEGNSRIVLCERGIRASCSWDYSRNVLDLNVIRPLRELTPLPIVVDPSHAAGLAEMVPPLALAALGAGADGLLIEAVASEPMRHGLRCDGSQGVVPEVLEGIVRASRGAAFATA